MYSPEALRKVALDLQSVYPPFQVEEFLNSIFDETWGSLELKARGRHICMCLGKYLPSDYPEAISIIDKVIVNYGNWLDGIFYMFFLDFVEVFGQDEIHWDISIGAMERYTIHESAEFAVRPFIINHEKRMMEQMYAWAKHENEHVRRLASEGCRPALPWAQALPSFKKDPTPVLPILEELKNDPSEWVRRSVANNLNDISKTHPELVVKIAKEWYGKNEQVDWVVKHGCRTLLKKGNRDALALFGYSDVTSVAMSNFAFEKTSISIGDDLTFSFSIHTKTQTKVRLEYAVDYVKAKEKRSRKIFKISEITLKENEKKDYIRKHSFADVSVRKHYPGTHSIALIINGVECESLDFELLKS